MWVGVLAWAANADPGKRWNGMSDKLALVVSAYAEWLAMLTSIEELTESARMSSANALASNTESLARVEYQAEALVKSMEIAKLVRSLKSQMSATMHDVRNF